MFRIDRRPSPAWALVLAALAAACGGAPATTGPVGTGSGPAPTGPGGGTVTQAPVGGELVDACALLSAADIQDVTGLDTASSEAGPQGGVFASGCLWELIGERSLLPPTIALGVMRSGGKDFYDRNFAALDAQYERIDGLGDVAVDAEFGTVHVVSGDTFFQVQYIGDGGGGDSTENATELARKVVANLGG